MNSADFLARLAGLSSVSATGGLKKEVNTRHLNGAVKVTATALDLDTDGYTAPGVVMDKTHQSGTSLRWPKGSPVNSNETRFVVAPGGGWLARHGLKLGDVGLACVVGCDSVVSVIVADIGPKDKISEGSMQLHRELGHETLINGRIKDVGIDKQFTMLLFPGTSTGHCMNNATHEALAWARFEKLIA